MHYKMFSGLLLLVIGLLFHRALAGKFDKCTEYDVIPEANYTSPQYQDVNDINDPNGRPWAFLQAVIPYSSTSNADATNPCYQVTLTDRMKQTIKFMATGVVSGSTVICVESDHPGSGATNEACQSGVTSCKTDPIGGQSNVVKYSFSCQGCEADTAIWLRFTVSPEITENLKFESWCADTDSSYPNDLIQLPGQPDKTQPNPTSEAVNFVLGTFSLLFIASIMCFFM